MRRWQPVARASVVPTVGLALSLAVGCGAAGRDPRAGRRTPAHEAAPAQSFGKDDLASAPLAYVPGGTFGPYVGSSAQGSLALWAAGEPRGWYSAPLPRPDPARIVIAPPEPVRFADAPPEVGVVAVERVPGAGWMVLATTRGDGPERVEVILLGPAGELSAGPLSVGEADRPVLWIAPIATDHGLLALWAIDRDGKVEIVAAELSRRGALIGAARPIASDVTAWQAVRSGNGAALALARGGKLELLTIDSARTPVGEPVPLATDADSDVDLLARRDGFLLAYSTRRGVDTVVQVQALDAQGKPRGERSPVTPVLGDQALVSLVGLPDGPAFIGWESLADVAERGRLVTIAPVSDAGLLGAERARLASTNATLLPELVATPRGVAAITLAPPCPRKVSCTEQLEQLTFVELDEHLAPRAAEPLLVAVRDHEPASLAWGLDCRSGACLALVAGDEVPAPVDVLRLERRSDAWRPPVLASEPGAAAALTTLDTPESVADIAADHVGDRTLVAWITYFDPQKAVPKLARPGADGRSDPPQAKLTLVSADAAGNLGPQQVLSTRARSLGGVAVSADPKQPEALVAWTALDQGQPQTFVTLVDATGKKLAQRMITAAKGEDSDVALQRVDDGWIVAWIDERDGNPEVYSAKVNRLLQRVAPESRVTRTQGDASAPALARIGKSVVLVWADARDPERPGLADVWATRLSPVDGKPIEAEHRLAATPDFSHSPVLGTAGSRGFAAWIEEAASAENGAGAVLRFAEIDEAARIVGASTRVDALGGLPTSLTLACGPSACSALVDVATTRSPLLVRVPLVPEPQVTRLLGLAGAAGQSVPLVALGELFFFGEQATSERARVRSARLAAP